MSGKAQKTNLNHELVVFGLVRPPEYEKKEQNLSKKRKEEEERERALVKIRSSNLKAMRKIENFAGNEKGETDR